ncbi:hypothetical protein [Kitasatospora azatica]|uniref:hypothetical protein n=1 Tax=Kitasatospora azatica TaxID=58347 RepID=UPI00068BE4B9|nr:hypothetical protein [Kitasatospora azatica]
MPADDDFHDLIDALGSAGRQFATETDPLVTGGLTRGRSLRRRRAVALTGGVTALAAVGVVGVLVGTPGSPSRHTETVTAASPSMPDPSGSQSPDAAPGTTKEQMLAIVKSLLPPGRTSLEVGEGTAEAGSAPRDAASATMDFDDGHGKARFRVQLGRVIPTSVLNMTRCPDPQSEPVEGCTSETTPDGSTLTLLQGYLDPGKRTTKLWQATLLDPAGWLIMANEWNAPAEQPTEASRPDPPLSLAQLGAIVTNQQAWAPVRAGAAPYPTHPAAPPRVDGKELRTTLEQLLPAGLTTSGSGGDSNPADAGYTRLIVDDGKGASLVQVNVQDWSAMVAADSEMVLKIFGHAQVLPDGSKVAVDTDADPGGERGRGSLMWQVEVLRKDGIRVVVSALNSSEIANDATRSKPALTVEQLTTIATSPRWKLHG